MELKYKGWNELPIGKYLELKALEDNPSEYLGFERLAILCDCDMEDILRLPMMEVRELSKGLGFLTEKIKIKEYKKIRFNGVTYRVTDKVKDLTVAQYIDFDTFKTDVRKYYTNILSVVLVPEGKEYGEVDGFQLAEEFKGLDVETAEGVCFFFMKSLRRQMNQTLLRYIWTMGKMAIVMRGNNTMREMYLKQMKEYRNLKEHIDGLDSLIL